jgi:hypothetical protein
MLKMAKEKKVYVIEYKSWKIDAQVLKWEVTATSSRDARNKFESQFIKKSVVQIYEK